MFRRQALEILNFGICCVIGLTLHQYLRALEDDIDDAVKKKIGFRIKIDSYVSAQFMYFLFAMVIIYFILHIITIFIYNRWKSCEKKSGLNLKREHLVLDELERQKRSGKDDDPYTKALKQIVITEVLTPKSKRKNMNLNTTDSIGFERQTDNTASKTSFKKLWCSIRSAKKAEPPAPGFIAIDMPDGRVTPLLGKKLNPAPPLPKNQNQVAIHTPKARRKLSLDSKSNNMVQKRIAELTSPKPLQGYSNHALTHDEPSFKRYFKSMRK